jgi:ribosome-associated protein
MPKTAKHAYNPMPSREKAAQVAAWLEDRKATDVIAMDVSGVCPVTETIVVASAGTARHAKGLADALLDRVSEADIEFLGMEGYDNAVWILIDLNDVMVHIFHEDSRSLYDVEGLWAEGENIPWET